ncbi:MAG: DoxX family protein [Pseudomonadota bacterium]
MDTIRSLHDATLGSLGRALDGWFLPTLARFAFAAVLLQYFWNSALTKVNGISGMLNPTMNAYVQIFPKQMEAVGYDVSQFGTGAYLVVLAGTVGEFVLPALIVAGLFTRIAAIGMVIFVVVQSYVDVVGHGIALDAWFDGPSNGVILDQRLLWLMLFAVLIVKGAGPLSLDRVLTGLRPEPVPSHA